MENLPNINNASDRFMLTSLVMIYGIFWFAAIMHVLVHQFYYPSAKWKWLIILVVLPVLGLLLYYFIGRKDVIPQ